MWRHVYCPCSFQLSGVLSAAQAQAVPQHSQKTQEREGATTEKNDRRTVWGKKRKQISASQLHCVPATASVPFFVVICQFWLDIVYFPFLFHGLGLFFCVYFQLFQWLSGALLVCVCTRLWCCQSGWKNGLPFPFFLIFCFGAKEYQTPPNNYRNVFTSYGTTF